LRLTFWSFVLTPSMASTGQLSPIFLIDDNADDLFLMRQRLQRAGVENPVLAFDDGEEAMAELKRSLDEPQKLPCAMFLDLRMPRCGGFEVLKWVRAQQSLSRTKVYIVSTSALPEDAARAKQLGADQFMAKYPSPEALAEAVKAAQSPRRR
jgi:CheY-like chemotaxis protein